MFGARFPDAWVVSTHNLHAHLSQPALRSRTFAGMVAYCAFGSGAGLDVCENEPCAMNNSDSVDESAVGSLLLCPCCVRKLERDGVVADARACYARLAALLPDGALLGGCANCTQGAKDRRVLRSWGFDCPERVVDVT